MKKRFLTDTYGRITEKEVVCEFDKNSKEYAIQQKMLKEDFNIFSVNMLFSRQEKNVEQICFNLHKNRIAIYCTIEEIYKVFSGSIFEKLGDDKINYFRKLLEKEKNTRILFDCQKFVDKKTNPLKHIYCDVDYWFYEVEKIESFKERILFKENVKKSVLNIKEKK